MSASENTRPLGDEFAGYSFDNFARHAKEQGWTVMPEDPTEIMNRDLLTTARLSLSQAGATTDADTFAELTAFSQAAATIVLAEQQRIANIIAWEHLTHESNRSVIREGLGL